MQINVISEGVTDQTIIEAVVQGYTGEKDLVMIPLQPKKDAPGGWPLVVSYCKSNDFKESLPYNEGVTIIHIDCDVLKGAGLPDDCIMQFNNLSVADTFEMVKQKILEFITPEIYALCGNKIAFAIGIDMVECWFLPLYFSNKKAICNKITGCIDALNPALDTKHGFYIKAKDPANYDTIVKAFRKRKDIDACASKNESFALFVDSLKKALNALENPDD